MNALGNSSPLSKIIYLFIFSFVGLFLAGSLITVADGFLDGQVLLSPWGLRLSSGVQMVLMFFMPAITVIIWSGHKPLPFLGLNGSSNSYVLFILAFVIFLVGIPSISLLSQLNQMLVLPNWLSGLELWMKNLEESAQTTTNLLLDGTSIWDYLGNILFIGIFAAVAEEVFFRGVLQQVLIKLFKNKHAGVWMAAFIFSLMHMQFYGFIPRIILGAMLGYLFAYSKNLWIPIMVHFFNNALVVTLNFFFRDTTTYQYLEELPITSSFLISGVLSLGTLVFLLKVFQARAYKQIYK